ncbi:hypothetical protein [Shimia aestuarii]|uniref:HEAT repeat domain-containing protein n=1 Tax=Shimia aestuarii TaxID=254406 RepID=A0A1I4HYT2_9RHOB|nr:hypothetical protein [Shimia aestuarii]SFL47060.1 hypothetical protein SAMN04488042_101322 [Shimia aestuarii]
MIRVLVTVLGATLAASGVALACGFHGYVPEETAVDRLLASDRVVLARPSAENPFRYEAQTILRGSVTTVDIPHLVDSGTRRMLRSNPDHAVLFARDGANGTWQRVAYLDPGFDAVMDAVLARLDEWRLGGDWERYQFFANLLGHPHPAVAQLALGELDRAPYPVLVGLNLTPDADRLLQGINAPENRGSLPIRVLLLGLSDAKAARAFLRRQFQEGRAPRGVVAGAYGVALIESVGLDGVTRVASALQASRDPVLRESLMEALAMQAEAGEGPLVDEIRARVGVLLANDPDLALIVARHFGRRADWSQIDILDRLMSSGSIDDPETRYEVDQYLRAATEALFWENN